MNKVFIPYWTKQQFVNCLVNKYGNETNGDYWANHFNKMKKNQLIAIFINTK